MKKIILIIILVLGTGFLWYAFSPLLFNVEVQDELAPEIEKLLNEPTDNESPGSETEKQEPVTEIVSTTTVTESVIIDNSVPDHSAPPPQSEIGTDVSEEPSIVVTKPFNIIGTSGHSATGEVRLIKSPTETLVRYENYDGTNGPDLYVYLANDLEATEFVSLGQAKGNQGNINYTVPSDIDIDEYKYVMTWCQAFGVLFDYAEIK